MFKFKILIESEIKRGTIKKRFFIMKILSSSQKKLSFYQIF